MAFPATRLVVDIRDEINGLFDGLSTAEPLYFLKLVAQDNSKTVYMVWGDGVPNTTYLADLPLDSLYIDYTNHKAYIKTAAATFTVIGAQS